MEFIMAVKKKTIKKMQPMHNIEKGCCFPSDRRWNSLSYATFIYNGILADENGERGF